MAHADGTVLPRPGIPKTLGILNVIFGVLMILYGLCTIGILIVSPFLLGFVDRTVKDVQARAEAQQKVEVKGLEDREKAATTEEEKAAIRQERDAVIARKPRVIEMDMSITADALKDPVLMGYSLFQMGSEVVLSVILLVAGVGLIRLAPWGRSVSVAWAGLQIAQLVLISGIGVIYIQPIQRPKNEQMLARMEADARGPNAAPGAMEIARWTRRLSGPSISNAIVLAILIGGSIYPVVVLVLLNKPGARAALLGPKRDGRGEF